MTTTARPSLMAFVKALASAKFSPMSRSDFRAFADAPADTLIADNVVIDGTDYVVLLTSGAGADEEAGAHFYDLNTNGCVVLSLDTL